MSFSSAGFIATISVVSFLSGTILTPAIIGHKAVPVVALLKNCTKEDPVVSQPTLAAFPIVLGSGIGVGILASQQFCVKRVPTTPLAIESAVQETVVVTEARFPLAISSSSAAKPYIPRSRRHVGATNNRRYEDIGHRRAPDPSVL